MKIVRKISRKKSGDFVLYENEWFLVPIQAKKKEIVRPWIGEDLKVQVEQFA